MTTLLITHPCFLGHDTGPGHPERPDRMRALDKVMAHEMFAGLDRREAPLRDDVETWIALAHPQAYIDMLKEARPREGDMPVRVDPDTVLSPGSWEAALRAVGAGLLAVDEVMARKAANAFCQVRPPGHHAERDRAMGFCFFNSIAIAAMYARARHGAERIAVVDFDVHHGNGTQAIFQDDPRVLYASAHEMPLFPDSGHPKDRGTGNVHNAALRAGTGSHRFREAWRERLLPAVDAFAPELLLLSAGFDGHRADPVAHIELEADDYTWLTCELVALAGRHAGGRVVSMLEGGYDLAALAECSVAHVRALLAGAGA